MMSSMAESTRPGVAMELAESEIRPGVTCLIASNITIGGLLAFKQGDLIKVSQWD